MRNALRLSFAILVSIAAWSGCSSTTSVSPARTYRIGMVHWAAYSPLNVADVKGFWKSRGIDVEVINYAVNADLNSALDDSKIDIALDMIGSWVDLRLQGKPITIIGETDWSNGGDKIILKSGRSLNSLKGQSFGTYLKMLSVENFIAKYLTANGLTFSDFTAVQESDPSVLADKFINGTYNIVADYDPQAARAVTAGSGVVAATSADYPGCIPEGFAARSNILAGIPTDDLVQIFAGWIDAVKWAEDPSNWTEYASILNSKTFEGEGGYSDADLKSFLANVSIHTQSEQRDANKIGGGLYTYLTNISLFASQNGFPGTSFTPQDVFDNTAIMKALGN